MFVRWTILIVVTSQHPHLVTLNTQQFQLKLGRNLFPIIRDKNRLTMLKDRTSFFHNRTMKISATNPSIKLANTYPVTISTAINVALGPHPMQSISKCRDGSLLITASANGQYGKLSNLTILNDYEVKTIKHNSSPSCF